MAWSFDGIVDGVGDFVGDLATSAGERYLAEEFPEKTETNPVPQTSAPDTAIAEVQQVAAESGKLTQQQMLTYGGLAIAGLLTLYLVVK